ncbi:MULTISPECIES: hypothetical protein [Methanobacterium]|uniref:Uncharacterized protein n=1 Tax=Methanobacterium veterum TaxID=408577 RepID=A0A9E5A240_9EURY|nr:MULTISPECIES: hypothetical protein [Methanobacterium]MCZ3365393.1 hypothetical protein [Methanobacterium veterum]MCZ3373144.1 hypothetical protein [Methanobacterium veterum]
MEELRKDITRMNKKEAPKWTDEERQIIREYAQSLVKPEKPPLVYCNGD